MAYFKGELATINSLRLRIKNIKIITYYRISIIEITIKIG